MFKILIIIPAFNESENIEDLIIKFTKLNFKTDILVINDASTDDTSVVAKKCNVVVADLPVNLGIGGAVQTGYLYAYYNDYDIAIQVDGDGQHNPEFISEMIEPIINKNADLVIGSRFIEYKGFQSSFLRRIGIRLLQIVLLLITKKNITDPTSGFRACNKEIISIFAKTYPSDYPEPESVATIVRKGYKIIEIPVIMNERNGGESSIKSFKSIYYMVKVSLAIMFDKIKKI